MKIGLRRLGIANEYNSTLLEHKPGSFGAVKQSKIEYNYEIDEA